MNYEALPELKSFLPIILTNFKKSDSRVNQYLKDRIEGFEDYYPCR